MQYETTLTAHEAIAITIGNFDGVHRGHQRLMHELVAMARELHCTPVLVTFSPHTLEVVRPDIDLQLLTPLDEKLALTARYGGIADSIVIHFTPEVVAMSAEAFMDNLCANFAVKGMVVGANFSLGHNRMGDVSFLEQYGKKHGIKLAAIPLQENGRERISSTRIRKLVSEGEIAGANELLGHPLTFSGIVQHGDQRGRLIGFPTANLLPEPHRLIPANGVYAVRVIIGDMAQRDATGQIPVYNGVTNIGVRPTFNGTIRLVEVHLLDIQPDLYDQRITISFIARLRSEQRFAGIEALKAQIALDAQQGRQLLAAQAAQSAAPLNGSMEDPAR
ncbi:MAG TPA: bifunctional riboflavin kinase/FAD synthetase [Ktedonobacteraceae bacterium]|nr:bifunctional riboflavin kinase/FAD synthetase [Ktedonobacteraceae bacterium]